MRLVKKISKQVEASQLKFPVVIKSDGCVRSLSKHSHDVILAKNEAALQDLIVNRKCNVELVK